MCWLTSWLEDCISRATFDWLAASGSALPAISIHLKRPTMCAKLECPGHEHGGFLTNKGVSKNFGKHEKNKIASENSETVKIFSWILTFTETIKIFFRTPGFTETVKIF